MAHMCAHTQLRPERPLNEACALLCCDACRTVSVGGDDRLSSSVFSLLVSAPVAILAKNVSTARAHMGCATTLEELRLGPSMTPRAAVVVCQACALPLAAPNFFSV